MSAPDITAADLKVFENSGITDHSTILLGAGASITSGLPDWNTLAVSLLLRSNAVKQEEVAELLLNHQDPMIVVESAKVESGESWNVLLKECLYADSVPVAELIPSALHRAVVGHFLAKPDKTSLVTLNFDAILELALENELEGAIKVESITSGAQTEKIDATQVIEVHHLHGIITPDYANDVILTFTDFAQLIEQDDSWQVKYLHQAVQKGALIIAGTSYRDPDLRQWLFKALQEKPKGHSAFVLLARQAFNLTKERFHQIKPALSSQWRAIGLVPVFVNDHTDTAQIIRELRHANSEGYKSPDERCKEIWDFHQTHFHKKQYLYVAQLSEQAFYLKEIFDTTQIDLSLWISNGDGKLVKLASMGRIYNNVDVLKVVETGHDSEWIAGQALGSDDTLLVDLEENITRRWNSVVAVPVSTEHPELPPITNAVITIGLPLSIKEALPVLGYITEPGLAV
ncbi:hypothetical protein C627_15050 [Corynebacterium glutamicum ZL-6]|uniref:SIR2 family protein n=1 Tax=Corynebacterium TaxID=1716 RepID=UPI00080736F3|nr:MULTISPECIES: SIR2 family protein [Corynebacterium]ANR63917.1 hypothetical protein C628_15185 [[Brevibacterium] flavum ZL-1]ANR66925.1 hypothetical protein C627_15050 [Corynebacterium glutamicum ZL-6]PST74148.1 hypothetical protein I919_15240 [Corynebacterium glutamicum ZL-2]